MRRTLLLALLASVIGHVTPATAAGLTAQPGEVTAIAPQFLYAGKAGEANHVTITQSGNDVTLSDPGSSGITITPGSTGCTPNSSTSITCTTAPGWVLGIGGGDGDDTITVDANLQALILGGNGDDVLDGTPLADEIGGDNGDDVIRGDGGADILGGNNGYDVVDYSTSLQPVTVTIDGNADDGALGEGDFVDTTFEAIRGSAFDDDLTAADSGSVLDGGPGSDTLRGARGDDRFHAADGVADKVTCGDGTDAVDNDAFDVVALDCESVSTLPAPDTGGAAPGDTGGDVGRTTQAVTPKTPAVEGARASGKVLITVGGKTRELKADEPIPATAVVDTRQGAITLTAAPDADGKVARATFHGGQFRVARTKEAHPITELSLAGSLSCPKARKAVAAKKKPKVRRLWGSGHGRFRTRGRYASAAVRGTIWLTEDRCDGTLVKVRRGVVTVRDQRRHKTVSVRAGKQYLAHTG